MQTPAATLHLPGMLDLKDNYVIFYLVLLLTYTGVSTIISKTFRKSLKLGADSQLNQD